jgi:hypothetical protein
LVTGVRKTQFTLGREDSSTANVDKKSAVEPDNRKRSDSKIKALESGTD